VGNALRFWETPIGFELTWLNQRLQVRAAGGLRLSLLPQKLLDYASLSPGHKRRASSETTLKGAEEISQPGLAGLLY
jgi:hypothetical protein